MDSEKLDNPNNFHNFIKQQEKMLATFTVEQSISTSILEPEALFLFLKEHFDEFHQKEYFRAVLAFVHRCIKVWVCEGDYLKCDIGVLLLNLLEENHANEKDKDVFVQIVYQFLNSFKLFDCKGLVISEKLLRELAAILLTVENPTLTSNYIACIEKYIEIFPKSCKSLDTLWLNLKQNIDSNIQKGLIMEVEIDILMQLFVYFKLLQSNSHDDPILITIIQHLLKSDKRRFRKCGYFLFKNLYLCFNESVPSVDKSWLPKAHIQNISRSCTTYITILENLEDEQSHLILPSMENLKELITNQHMHMSWLNVLYTRLLTHNNNLVLRRSFQFFLETFSCRDLRKDTIKHLLQVSNCNSLFNSENNFFTNQNFTYFLQGDLTILLTLFSEIENWKSLPLYKWLESINEIPDLKIYLTFAELLQFSACVRMSQNKIIRNKSIQLCNLIFKDNIEIMPVHQYVMFIETLYNKDDNYYYHSQLFSKNSSVIPFTKNIIFTQKFYDIFIKHPFQQSDLLMFLKGIPVEKHGWLKFAPFNYKLSEQEMETLNNMYNMDLNVSKFRNVDESIQHFKLLNLSSCHKDEVKECERVAVSFYIYQKNSWEKESDLTLHSILNYGFPNYTVLNNFAKIFFVNMQKTSLNLIVFDQLLKFRRSSMYNDVFCCLARLDDERIVRKYACTIIKEIALNQISNVDLENFQRINVVKEVIDEILSLLPSQGDKRIEELFLVQSNAVRTPLSQLYTYVIRRMEFSESLATDLLKLHSSITNENPTYFANTLKHRVKLRIAVCMYYMCRDSNNRNVGFDKILNEIWSILMNENNQLNVAYIYEFILGRYESKEDTIIELLKKMNYMTSRQQVSVITVAYTYFASHETSVVKLEEVVNILLPFSMGANFQTRLFAQLSIFKLLNDNYTGAFQFASIIKHAIKNAVGDQIDEYLSDIRFNFNDISDFFIESVLYITKAPFDELVVPAFCPPSGLKEKIERCRERYINKLNLTKNEETATCYEVNDQIQRKMNPTTHLTPPHNLIVYPTEEKSAEMYVVASLIDKLPNLGGIARTCEVLGIRNLVMDSKMHTEKKDFKSVSMTAEKTLSIHEVKPKDLKEFLMLKKMEGFSIVGAEQTCKSKSFNNFQFPQKSVLLLGHEKDGIPAPLLSILDSAVEIPQFGQVRSLNVHVTGALFMWEYCKQHLVQK